MRAFSSYLMMKCYKLSVVKLQQLHDNRKNAQ